MSRALFFAGARCVVLSLWPVADLATAQLMRSFYREPTQRMAPEEVLRRAKLALRERFPDAYYWAAFVAVGVGPRAPTSGSTEDLALAVDSRAAVL